jgi:hypothetical protein
VNEVYEVNGERGGPSRIFLGNVKRMGREDSGEKKTKNKR